MGCDIHTITEIRINGSWSDAKLDKPVFDWRSYGMYGFLAAVRNYSSVPCLWAGRGWPEDLSLAARQLEDYWEDNSHSHTYVTLRELVDFDYDQMMEDRRTIREISPGFYNGGVTVEEGKGEVMTYRAFLLGGFFREIERLKQLGAPDDVRVLMLFDN